jgi:hypothetical protein
MDLNFLQDFFIPIVIGICLCVGYILKNIVTTDKINRFIPLIMGVLGFAIAFWINNTITPEVLLKGLISGLSSTGLYELFKNFINKR